MSLLAIAEVRALVRTALDDVQLQTLIEREETDIIQRYGAHFVNASTPITEILPGDREHLFLSREIDSVTSVKERIAVTDAQATLAATAYYVRKGEGALQRVPLGTFWGAEVEVSYVPQDDNPRRKQVLLELVRLALERTAMKSEAIAGEYSYNAPDWDAERARLIRSLGFTEV